MKYRLETREMVFGEEDYESYNFDTLADAAQAAHEAIINACGPIKIEITEAIQEAQP